MAKSSIEWTDATWNPVTGCTKISPGCKHCYAERMAKRLKAMGQRNYANGFELTLQPHSKRSAQAVLSVLVFGVSISEVSTIFSWTLARLSV